MVSVNVRLCQQRNMGKVFSAWTIPSTTAAARPWLTFAPSSTTRTWSLTASPPSSAPTRTTPTARSCSSKSDIRFYKQLFQKAKQFCNKNPFCVVFAKRSSFLGHCKNLLFISDQHFFASCYSRRLLPRRRFEKSKF